eukprot:11655949-Prorocentrum_lima.AAC.1
MIAITLFHTTGASPWYWIHNWEAATCGMPGMSNICCETVAATRRTRPICRMIPPTLIRGRKGCCLLYTSDAADDM